MIWPPQPVASAPPLEWARFYLSLGWLPLPTRCDADIDSYARYLADEERRSRVDAGRKVFDADIEAIKAQAREDAEATRRAPMVPWRARSAVTAIEVDAWWGKGAGKRGPKRGIWVAMGRLSEGAPAGSLAPMAVDVDPRHGGDSSPWEDNGGPLSRTPGGGIHALHVWDSRIPTATAPNSPGPGIDVRASGGGIVVPSGISSPGRSWERWEPLVGAPEALVTWALGHGARAAVRGAGASVAAGGAAASSGSRAATGGIAAVLASPAPDGTRNATAAQIIGMLARPKAIPEDALEPALALLREAGHEDIEGWRRILTRGPRDEETAVIFLAAWNAVRADPSWTMGKVVRTARSLWRTAQRRDPRAGAEDLHHGEEWSTSYATPAGAVALGDDASPGDDMSRAIATVLPAIAVPTTPALPSDQVVMRKVPDPLAIPDLFCIDLQEAYTPDDMEADLAVTPVSLAALPPWRHFDNSSDLISPYGYGMGPWFDASLAGGLVRGSFLSVGALTAKAGKTTWLQQAIDGLILQSSLRLRAHFARLDGRPLADGDLDDGGPILCAFWLTEMEKHRDLARRMVGRYLEVDTSFWSRGTQAHLAPGIQQVSIRYSLDPEAAAIAVSKRVRQWVDNPISTLALMRRLTVNLDPAQIPRPKMRGRGARDPRRGVGLLDLTARAIERRVQMLAEEWQVDPSRFLPVIVLDPVQRFVDASGEDRLTAINEIVHEARGLAHGKHWIVAATSDTTKAGAGSDKDMDGDPAALAASAFAGSQNLAHEPDTVIVLHAEQVDPPSSGPRIVEVPVRVRVCLCRRAAAGPALPFRWQPHYGRYFAIDPAHAPRKGESHAHQAAPPMSGQIFKRRGRPKKGATI